tara:strand:- start:219 stop:1847 length:1629 start_codon:yes stop_codon:yes gene_type:complete
MAIQDDHLIDGQQRIVTLYLLLMAMTQQALEQNLYELSEHLSDLLLYKPKGESSKVCKIDLNPKDMAMLSHLYRDHLTSFGVETKTVPDNQGLIVDAFNYHVDRIKEIIYSDEEPGLMKFSDLLEIVISSFELLVVELESNREATVFYQRLNQSGTELTTLDVLRTKSYQLASRDPNFNQVVHNNRWQRFEDELTSIPGKNMADRYTHLVARIYRADTKKESVVQFFQEEWQRIVDIAEETRKRKEQTGKNVQESKPDSYTEQIIDHIAKYAEVWKVLNDEQSLDKSEAFSSSSENVKTRVQRFQKMAGQINEDAVYFYLIQLLYYYINVAGSTDENEAEGDVARIMQLVEIWLVRQTFARSSNRTRYIFEKLWGRVGADPAALIDYFNQQSEFLSNERLIEGIRTQKLYQKPLDLYILRIYEESHPGDPVDIKPDETQIEHILPQNPRHESDWFQRSGFSEEDFKEFVSRWANLTLITETMNREASNSDWESRKKYLLQGSQFRQTQVVAKEEIWNKKAFLRREETLIEFATSEWPLSGIE